MIVLKNKTADITAIAECVQKFVDKLAQRELTLQMLPPSLHQAIETMNAKATPKPNDDAAADST